MSEHEEFKAEVLRIFKEGYEKAPAFIEAEGKTYSYFLKALMHGQTVNRNPREILLDAGAIRWCLDQLEKESDTSITH